jgi:hypothetical protein
VEAHFTREMGLTADEFLRTLPDAIGHGDYRIQGSEILIRDAGGGVRILLHATRQRRLGMLALPVTPVEFSFQGLDPGERAQFMTRFERHFQRGGG